jgi:hypothetical protein
MLARNEDKLHAYYIQLGYAEAGVHLKGAILCFSASVGGRMRPGTACLLVTASHVTWQRSKLSYLKGAIPVLLCLCGRLIEAQGAVGSI